MKQHFQQIDVLKCAAIIAVIVLHTLTRAQLIQTYAIFHIWQAVPVFMIVMGLNLGLSSKPDQASLARLYSKDYFTKKAMRIVVPFLIVFFLALLIGLLWQLAFNKYILTFNKYTFIGLLPITGKGNYFITLLLQSIIVLPLLGYVFQKHPVFTTLGLLLLEILFLTGCKHFGILDNEDAYLYSAALPRYFTALAYGLWLSKIIKEQINWTSLIALILLASIGATYLYLLTYKAIDIPYIYESWASQNVMSFGYAALLVILFIYFLPTDSNNRILKVLTQIGHASYHIFLVQVVYFGLPINHNNLLLNLGSCIGLGYIFYRTEKEIRLRQRPVS